MKKTTFGVNFAVWVGLAALCIAFLAWYHATDLGTMAQTLGESAFAQLGVILSAPVLLYAIGVVIGLLVIWIKKIELSGWARVTCRVVSVGVLVLFVLTGLPVFFPQQLGELVLPALIVYYVAMAAPVFHVFLGFVYALGCAPVSRKRRSRLDQYLPDDHFADEGEKDADAEKDAR